MNEWQNIALGEGLDRLIDYRGKSPPKAHTGVPVISAKCVKGGRIIQPIEQMISPNYYPIWMTRGLPLVGDVVMTTEGPLGEVAQLDEETVTFALAQRVVCMRGKRGALDNKFLKFLLMSPIQQAILSSYATGTTVAGISQKSLRSVPITIPPYGEQVAIGTLLGALDDKIDLNRRMNETLEAMARAIFKDWFVDFGPTMSKMEGRAPYLAPDLWTLFPNRLDHEDKPEGWDACDLNDLVELNPSERLLKGTLASYIDMAALPVRGSCADAPILREAGSGARFRNGDTLFARITPCLENGKTAHVTSLRTGEVAWGSTEFIVMRPRPPVPSEFAYLLARDESFRAHAVRSMTGTSGRQRAQSDALRTFCIVRPPDNLLRAFGALVSAKFQKIASNAIECETLTATRDLLLPGLMSGEIRVRQAERALEAAL